MTKKDTLELTPIEEITVQPQRPFRAVRIVISVPVESIRIVLEKAAMADGMTYLDEVDPKVLQDVRDFLALFPADEEEENDE
jgi:hypothetical protein